MYLHCLEEAPKYAPGSQTADNFAVFTYEWNILNVHVNR